MNVRLLSSLRPASLLAAGTLLCAGSAFAADTAGMSPQQRYQAERAACEAGQTGQARADCMREAGAALQERQRGNLNRANGDYSANATARCDRLPPERREGCMALRGDNVQVQGSVKDGAILRQTTIREVGEPGPAGASMPPAGTTQTMPAPTGAPGTTYTTPGSTYTPPPAGTTAPMQGGTGIR
ncbi:hypothetical protein FOZ76_14675 [Verticiella sediminum]|uniref:Uncharacterized protein n=1 Tax=Verticiella sediminum TaxID=1247510 RepID=A0A556AIF4_9BURK|nr:hypothetical protein [Verticiella sediminum]TSH92659.1 hypothetical protein FOZ76_14675 [Verticiella sediminum]